MIDREARTPLYQQIYSDLGHRILIGEFLPGALLPSEKKLCHLYGVERATVRRALSILDDEGKVEKRAGLGTVVKKNAHREETSAGKNLLFMLPRGFHNVDRLSEPFNAKLLASMEQICSDHHLNLLYKSYSENMPIETLINQCFPAGIFLVSHFQEKYAKHLQDLKVPVVLINQKNTLYPSICIDSYSAATQVVEYLIQLGHSAIGFIGSSDAQSNERQNGYSDTMLKHNLTVNSDWIRKGDWSAESGRAAFRVISQRGKLPSALFAANDSMAIGAMQEAKSIGLRIPEDLSIVGFDNIDQAAYVDPALTTVAVNYKAMANSACMTMFYMLEHINFDLNINIYTPLSIVYRNSAAAK